MNASEKRALAVRYMKSRTRMNGYTNGGNRRYFFGKPDNDPGNTQQAGYSDCSSACRKAIEAAAGIDIGSNTDAQLRGRAKGLIVEQTDGCYPDESKLLPGDCLYFKGNSAHIMDVGHVEMYTGPNECYGHGSGTGPTKKNLQDYCRGRATAKKRYFMAVRWITGDGVDERRILKRGMEGADVALLQGNLIAVGYSVGSWGTDGDFGGDTEDAVIAFQTASGIEPDGVVGPVTWAALDAAMDALGDDDDPQPEPQPQGDLTVKPGSWYLRTGPGKQFRASATVHGGDRLTRLNIDGWVPVLIGGEIRFISEKALEA